MNVTLERLRDRAAGLVKDIRQIFEQRTHQGRIALLQPSDKTFALPRRMQRGYAFVFRLWRFFVDKQIEERQGYAFKTIGIDRPDEMGEGGRQSRSEDGLVVSRQS